MGVLKIFNESWNILFKTQSYYKKFDKKRNIGESLIVALIYVLISTVFLFIWSKIDPYTGLFFKQMTGCSMNVSIIFLFPVFTIILSSIVIVYNILISAICKGSVNINDIIHSSCSIIIVFPIFSFFVIGYVFSFYIGIVFTIILLLYTVWLWYNLNIYFLKADKILSIIAGIIFALLILFSGYKSVRTYSFFTKNIEEMLNKTIPQEKIPDDSEKNYRKSIKTMNKILQRYEK